MNILNDLMKLPDNELKEVLGNNDKIIPGKYFIFKNNIKRFDPPVLKIAFIDFNDKTIFCRGNSSMSYQTSRFNRITILTYDVFKQIVRNKYENVYRLFKDNNSIIDYFKKILGKNYNNEQFDVHQIGDSVRVVFHIPEMKIKNSLESEHTIRDLYLLFTFYRYENLKSIILYSVKLFRATYTVTEIYHNYLHSHYSGDPNNSSGNICFGNTELGHIVKGYKEIMFNPKDIVYLITLLQTYLRWESIEGVPYKKIDTMKPFRVKEKTVDLDKLYSDKDLIKNIREYVYEKLGNFSYYFELAEDGSFVIKLNTSDKTKIGNLITDYFCEKGLNEFLVRNINGVIGDIEELTMDNVDTKNLSKLNLNGQLLFPTVIENPEKVDIDELNKIYKKSAPVGIIHDIVKQIETEFLEYIIKLKLNE